ncbi:hypothetical protein HKD37_08G023492 [Glycine soja]
MRKNEPTNINQTNTLDVDLYENDEQFTTSHKSLTNTLTMQFSFLKLIGIRGEFGVTILESFLVHYIFAPYLISMSRFKISYNTHKYKWSTYELLTMCVQEEEISIMEEGEKVNLTTSEKSNNNQTNYKGKIIE